MFDLKRRAFITLLGGTAAWPLAARAQQPRRVGVLMGGPATDSVLQAYVAAFGHALRQLGWIEGQNLRVDVRWNAGGAALAQTYAAQLIGLQPEVILAATLNDGPIKFTSFDGCLPRSAPGNDARARSSARAHRPARIAV
jgi:hypothetical protein